MRCSNRQYLPYPVYVELQQRLRRHRKEILLFCDHPPVITAGIKTTENSLILSEKQLEKLGISLIRIRRAGDLTGHEPGQIVIYPHTDLKKRGIHFSDYFKSLLTITRQSIKSVFNIALNEDPERPGLYTDKGEKVVSIGLDLGRSFSSYGLAVNTWNSLDVFQYIHPCGYKGLPVEALQNLGASPVQQNVFKEDWKSRFEYYLENKNPGHNKDAPDS